MRRISATVLGIMCVLWSSVPQMVYAQTGQTPVVGPPSITLNAIITLLAQRHSLMLPYATTIYAEGAAANIDPAFAMAIWAKESEWGTTGATPTTRNMGNLVCDATTQPPATACRGRWAVYPGWDIAIRDWYRYIQGRYIDRGYTTIETIIPIYAPAWDGNDTDLYIQQLLTWITQWGSGVVGTAPAPTNGGGGVIDDWVYKPLMTMAYALLRIAASMFWRGNAAALGGIDYLDQLRTTLTTEGFRPAVQQVATTINPLVQPLLVLGFCLGLALIIVRPVMETRWINLQRILVVGILVPILVPFAGATFQQLEDARANIGGLLYSQVFQQSSTALKPPDNQAQPQGVERDIQLTHYDATRTDAQYHGIDVAAAYIYTTKNDVMTRRFLPAQFETTYFSNPPTQFSTLNADDRWKALEQGGSGIARLMTDWWLLVFATAEVFVNLAFTISLGLLIIGLVVVLGLSWLELMGQVTAHLSQHILSLIMGSWGISVAQGLVVALLLKVMEQGNADLVLGVGCFMVVVEVVFLLVGCKFILEAFVGTASAATAGGVTHQELARGASAAIGAVTGGFDMGLSYNAAQQAGHSNTYAAGYALSRSRVGSRLTEIATAMGVAKPEGEFARGSYGGIAIGNHDPIGSRAQRYMRHDPKRSRTTPTPSQDNPAPSHGGSTGPTQRLPPHGGPNETPTQRLRPAAHMRPHTRTGALQRQALRPRPIPHAIRRVQPRIERGRPPAVPAALPLPILDLEPPASGGTWALPAPRPRRPRPQPGRGGRGLQRRSAPPRQHNPFRLPPEDANAGA